jgi:hypothetical protein
MRRERIVLDPEEVAVGRIEIDIHDGAIQVGEEGPDWGEYEINAFMAKQQMGEIPVDEELPNRLIVIPLNLGASGDFDGARIALQAWAAKVNHQGGGHLKREIIGGSYGEAGSKLYADCLKASLKLGGGTSQARDGVDTTALLTIEALPDFYGDRIEEDPFQGVGDAAQTHQILGSLPGRAEVFVKEKGGRDQLAMPWHFRRAGYDPDAPWAMNVEEWELVGAAEKATLAGSAAPKVVKHPSLGTGWTPIAAKTLPHAGVYEILVRVYTTSETPPELRLLWDVGDLVDPSENVAVPVPGSRGYYIINLGQVNLEELPIGEHRWRALLQARGLSGGENVSLDRLWFRAIAESSGKPTAPRRVTEGLAAAIVSDRFNQTSGNIVGKSPDLGSAYTLCPNSANIDFQVDSSAHRLKRTKIEDEGSIVPGVLFGRAVGSGSAKRRNHGIGNTFNIPSREGNAFGHIVRWVDSENFAFSLLAYDPVDEWTISIYKYVGKKAVLLREEILGAKISEFAGRLETVVFEGQVIVRLAGEVVATVEDADLGPEGVLAEGQFFLYDHCTDFLLNLRAYDNLEIWPVNFEAVNFASQEALLSHRGLYRKSPDGLGWGPIARQLSDLPRVPVSGPEDVPVELAVLTSRGDLDGVADSGRDPLEVQLSYRPCWSLVPGP